MAEHDQIEFKKIERKPTLSAPSRRHFVIFNSYIVPTTDTGDLFTVNSYDQERFSNDIPHLEDSLRATDTLDFSPRVSPTCSTSTSPFAFTSRAFSV